MFQFGCVGFKKHFIEKGSLVPEKLRFQHGVGLKYKDQKEKSETTENKLLGGHINQILKSETM